MLELELLMHCKSRLLDLMNVGTSIGSPTALLRKGSSVIKDKTRTTHKIDKNEPPAAVIPQKGLSFWQSSGFYGWLVFLFAFFLYTTSVFNNYNLDDELVTKNHRLTSKGISAIPEIFTSPYYQDQSGYSYEYRPVVLTSFAIEHQFFGDNPHISHILNVLLYAICCLLLYKLLRLLFKNCFPLLPLGISLLFAAHPAHTEVVCSIKNRDEILGLLFSFLAFYTTVKAIKTARIWLIVPVLLFMALALMSKVTVVSFIIIIPLAIILFSEAGIWSLTGITLALLVPAFFLLHLSGGFEKLKILSAMMVTVWLLYVLVNYTSVIHRFKTVAKGTYNYLFQKKTVQNFESSFFSIKDISKYILPAKGTFMPVPFVFTTILMALYAVGITQNYSMLAGLPLVALLILAWRGEERLSWWSTVMIGFCLTVDIWVRTSDTFRTASDIWYVHLLCLYFAYQMFFGKRGLFLPSLVCLAAINYLSISQLGNWTGLFTLLLVILNFKYARFIVLILLTGINIFMIARGLERLVNVLDFVTILLVILSIHYHKSRSSLVLILACTAFVVFHFYQLQFDKNSNWQSPGSTIAEMSERLNPEILTATQNRPLAYIEECVTPDMPLSVRAGTSFEILFHYLHKVILPYPLSFYYGYKFIAPKKITATVPIISLISHALLLLFAFVLLRRERLIAFGLFIYLISVVTFSNYLQLVPGMLADRFLLIPSLGWVIILVALLQKVFDLNPNSAGRKHFALPSLAKYAFAGILFLYSGITLSRNLDWKDDLTLFRHDIQYVHQSAQAHNLLALHLMSHSENEPDLSQKTVYKNEALFHLKKSREIYPGFFNVAYDIGRVYSSLNEPDSAIAAFQFSLTLDTTYTEVYRQLSSLLVARSRFNEAIPYLNRMLKLNPNDYNEFDLLSYSYFRSNQFDKSIEVNLSAVQHFPGLPYPLINLAKTYIAKNQPDSARIYLIKANEILPGNIQVQQMLKQTGK